jgi:tRNA pseudouridine55 synthase
MQRPPSHAIVGFLNVHKPSGPTSRAVLNRVARLVRGVKIGHAGTLDPLASGVLVVGLGPATRLIDFVQQMPKSYRTVVRLGARSDTCDADGTIEAVLDPPIPSAEAIAAALQRQLGTIEQRPPGYSAVKVRGRRAYDLARGGMALDLPPRPVTIYRIGQIDYAWPRLVLEIDCGAGTYIRSIVRDLGETLDCGGYVEELVRTRIGTFTIDEAIDPEHLTTATIVAHVLPTSAAVGHLPQFQLTVEQVAEIVQGRAVNLDPPTGEPLPQGDVALLGPDGSVVAVAEADSRTGRLQPQRVLVSG